jgi:(2Fe-2S) ferredoxin
MAEKKYRAYICCGPNCGPKDSRDLLDYLSREVARLGLGESVSALPTGCQAHCLSGPTMVVYPGPVYYQEVTRERLDRIIRQHFVEGQPVQDYFWSGLRIKLIPRRHSAPSGTQPGAADEEQERAPSAPLPRKPKREPPPVDDFKW